MKLTYEVIIIATPVLGLLSGQSWFKIPDPIVCEFVSLNIVYD